MRDHREHRPTMATRPHAGARVYVAALGLLSVATASPLEAQNMSHGANNFYVSERVTVQKVTFDNQYGMTVAGNLFIPRSLDRGTTHPAIIVGHPMGAVKEQSANLYATKMAEQGFVTLSLDLSFWGESEGQPRNLVSPDIYAEDFSAAVESSARSRSSIATGSACSGSVAAEALSSARPRSTRACGRSRP